MSVKIKSYCLVCGFISAARPQPESDKPKPADPVKPGSSPRE